MEYSQEKESRVNQGVITISVKCEIYATLKTGRVEQGNSVNCLGLPWLAAIN